MKKTEKLKIFKIKKTQLLLRVVKYVKNITGLNLKESKQLIDYLRDYPEDLYNTNLKDICYVHKDYIMVDVFINNEYTKHDIIQTFHEFEIDISFDDRKTKIKSILYFNQEALIADMLKEMGNWEKYVNKEDLESMTYNDCKSIAIEKIITKYKKFIKSDLFHDIYKDIERINKLEIKDIGFKFIKFNEEFGEFCAEYLKYKGLTYKEYNREELLGEMADALQVLLSIYTHIGEETNISIDDILEKILKKNKKWENKLTEYITLSDKNNM